MKTVNMGLFYLVVLIALVSSDSNRSHANSDDAIRSIRTELELYRTKMLSLEETVRSQTVELSKQSDELGRQTEQIDALQKMVNSCPCQRNREDVKRLLVDDGHATQNRIAFYAVLTQDLASVGNHQAFHFNDVKVNQGGCYTAVDGEFRTTVAGTYVFSWTISNSDGTWMESELVINGVEYGTLLSDSGNHNDYAVVSAMAIATLNVNDRVWIQSGTSHNAKVTGNTLSMSSFSGFLL